MIDYWARLLVGAGFDNEHECHWYKQLIQLK